METTTNTSRRAARRHIEMENPIGECACAECTRYDWEATEEDGVSLAEYRRTWYPEAWS